MSRRVISQPMQFNYIWTCPFAADNITRMSLMGEFARDFGWAELFISLLIVAIIVGIREYKLIFKRNNKEKSHCRSVE